ncbi:hypothetical protein [Gordonia insulae]|uniref:hypothetical protein n=1 Tax=Gordonia insulae TaxID=2420509 RepID=UPI000F5C09D5|nr:hypothetical protein [Gordonia insulae]
MTRSPETPPRAYYEPPTHPLHIRRSAARPMPSPRPTRRRIDPPVVIAAIVMIALAVGVIVGLAAL